MPMPYASFVTGGPEKDTTKSPLDSKGTLSKTALAFKYPHQYKAYVAAQNELGQITPEQGVEQYISRKFELENLIKELEAEMNIKP